MAELNKEPPSADLVGKYFVLHYYKVLREEPESLFKFYKEDSVFTFVSAPRATPVKTQGAEHIASLALSKCVAHIAGLDAQDAVGGGVLLLVRGTMSTGGDAPRKFVQSFFLAPQPTGYYVKNDIWRFVEEEVKTVAKAVIQSPVDTSSRTAQEDIASTAQAVTVQEPPQVPGSPAASEIAVSPSDRSVVSAASPVSQERTEVEKPSTGQALHEASLEEVSSLETVGTAGLPNESQNGNQAAAASPKEEQPASPATLGDASKPLVSVETQKPAAEPSWAALAARRPEPGSVVAPHITRPSASPQTKPKKEAPARSAEGAGVKQHQPVTSIYVSNLPYELEPQKLQDMFKVFGEIKAVAPSRGYAFIEYASAESAQKAIQAAQEKPLVADGRTLKVEKKKVRNVRRDKAKPGRDERRRPPEERSQNGQGAPSSTEKKRERPAGDKRSSPALTGNGRPADRSRAAPGSPATSASTGEPTTPKSQPKGRPAGK